MRKTVLSILALFFTSIGMDSVAQAFEPLSTDSETISMTDDGDNGDGDTLPFIRH